MPRECAPEGDTADDADNGGRAGSADCVDHGAAAELPKTVLATMPPAGTDAPRPVPTLAALLAATLVVGDAAPAARITRFGARSQVDAATAASDAASVLALLELAAAAAVEVPALAIIDAGSA